MKKILLLFIVLTNMAMQSSAQDQHYIDSLRALLKIAKQDTNKANILYQLSKSYLDNDQENSMNYANQTLALSKKIGFKKGIGNSYDILGLINYNQSNYSYALENHFAALKIRKEIGNQKDIIMCEMSIELIYQVLGNYTKALKNQSLSLKLKEEKKDKKGMADSYDNIGAIYRLQGNYPEALKNHFVALKIREEIGDKKGIADSYANIGSIYQRQGNYTEALKKHLAALKIFEEIGYKKGIAPLYDNIGLVYYKQGNYTEALKNYFNYLKIKEESGNKEGITGTYLKIGGIYIVQKKYNDASQYLNNALSLSKEIGSLMYIKNSHKWLAKLDSAQGKFKQALEHYIMFVIYRDSLYDEENTKKTVQTKMQYEFDNKEGYTYFEQLMKDKLAQKEMQKQKWVRNGFVGGFLVVLLFAIVFFWQRLKITKEKKKSDTEKNRSDELLLNILPEEVATELKNTGHSKAKAFTMVTVMFTDFKDFTKVSEKVSAEMLVEEIHQCFSGFDAIIQKYKIEKIKTIGDAYLCASGLPVCNYTHATDMVNAASEICRFMAERKKEKEVKGEIPFELRVGIHTGPVVAGIVGVKKYAYDIWGDTVNIAARMEQNSEAGKINISGSTYELVKDKFNCTHRGKIEAKNKGEIDMYFVETQ